MRVFRCIAYVMMPNGHRDKLDAKGTKCLFLGYGKSTKAYRLVCLKNQECEQVGDSLVAFQETKGEPIRKGYPSTSLSYNNCNEGMQPSLTVHRQGQPLEKPKILIREC